MTDSTEQLIAATGANKAPRVTPVDVEAQIASEHYFTAEAGVYGMAAFASDSETAVSDVVVDTPAPLSQLTFAVLVLKNGFSVTGESACASPDNFNAEVGRKVARQHAVDKCWALLGYELRTKLANQATQFEEQASALKQLRENGAEGWGDQEGEFQKAALAEATLASHPPVTVHDDGRLEFMRATPADTTPEVPGMPPHQVRMRLERDELTTRTNRLQRFIDSEDFAEVTEEEQFLMEDQLSAMQRHLAALLARIALFNEEQDNA